METLPEAEAQQKQPLPTVNRAGGFFHNMFQQLVVWINQQLDNLKQSPAPVDLNSNPPQGYSRFRDILYRLSNQHNDYLYYINYLDAKPRKLVVQATKEAIEAGGNSPEDGWQRVPISGQIPWVLTIAFGAWVTTEIAL
jgi:hypothetical protein